MKILFIVYLLIGFIDALRYRPEIGDVIKPYLSVVGKLGSTSDHFFITGISADTVSTLSLLKIDKQSLQILWKADFGNVDKLEDVVLKIMPSGNSYACGRAVISFASVAANRPYCVRIDHNGDITWTKEISSQSYQINTMDINHAETIVVVAGQTSVSVMSSSAFVASFNQSDFQADLKWSVTKSEFNLVSSLFIDGSSIFISAETLSDVSTATVSVQRLNLADNLMIWSNLFDQYLFKPLSIRLQSNFVSGIFLAITSTSNELITGTMSMSGSSQNLVKTGIIMYPLVPLDYSIDLITSEPSVFYIQTENAKLTGTRFSSLGQPISSRTFSEYSFQWSPVQIQAEREASSQTIMLFFQSSGKLVYLQIAPYELQENAASNIDTQLIVIVICGLLLIIGGSIMVFYCVKTLGERAKLREEMYKLQSASQLFDQQHKIKESAKLADTIRTKSSIALNPSNSSYIRAQSNSGNLFENNGEISAIADNQRVQDSGVRKSAALVSTREMPDNISSEKTKSSRTPTKEKEAKKQENTTSRKHESIGVKETEGQNQAVLLNQVGENVVISKEIGELAPLSTQLNSIKKPSFAEEDSSGSKTSKQIERNTTRVTEFTSTLSQVQTMISNQRELSLPGFLQYKQDIDFNLRQQIAKGGSATIFLGKILSGDMKARAYGSSLCIAKVLNVKEPSMEEIAMFGQEIAIMWFFRSNKNFVKLLGFTPTSPPIIIMKHYQHGSLTDLIYNDTQNITWTSNLIFRILRDVATALKEMHEAGFIHCDIKPSNILIDEDDDGFYAVLTDFGISRVISNSVLLVEAFMVANIDGASVIYAAPEVLKHMIQLNANEPPSLKEQNSVSVNAEIVKARDVYAFSMVSYEVINRNQPWSRKRSSQEIVQRVLEGERPDCTPEVMEKRKIDRKLASLCDLMEQCWAEDPASRLQMKWIVEILDQMAQTTAFKTQISNK